jgi:hypothetical protein
VSTVTFTGTAGPGLNSDLAGVKLVVDVNGNGTYESGTDGPFLGATQTYGAGTTVSFSASRTLTQGVGQDWLVLYDLGTLHAHNDQFTVSLAGAGDVSGTGGASAQAAIVNVSSPPLAGTTVTVQDRLQITQGGSPPPGTLVVLSQTDVPMLQINLLALDENVNVATLTVTGAANPGSLAQIAGVKLVVDVNGNGTYEGGTDGPFLGLTQTFGGGSTASFTVNRVLAQSVSEDWLVLYDFGAGHSHLDAFTASLNGASDVTAAGVTSGNPPNITVNPSPIPGNTMTVNTAGALQISDGGQTPGATTIPNNGTNILMLHFTVTETTSLEAATLNSLRFVITPGGTPVGNPQTEITQLSLFRDNGNATYEPGTGDPLVGAPGTVGGSNDVTLSSLGETIPSGGSVSYYVALDFNGTASNGSTFALSLTAADVSATGNTSSLTLPVTGSTLNSAAMTIGSLSSALTVAVAAGDASIANFQRRLHVGANADAAAALFTLTAPAAEGANVSAITLTHGGNAVGANHITAIRVWADVGTTGGAWDASDVLLASVSTGYGGGGTVALTLGSVRNIAAASSEDWLVTYDLSDTCPYARTFQVGVANAGDVTALGATSSNPLIILGTPANSSTRNLTGTWLQLSPTGPQPGASGNNNTISCFASIYDARNNRMVINGGVDDGGTATYTFYPNTYALDLNATPPNWVLIDNGTLANAPPRLVFHTAIYYTSGPTSYMLIWGGRAGTGPWPTSGATQNTAYVLNLNSPGWTQPSMTNTPNPTAYHGAVYDSTNHRMLVFGGLDGIASSFVNAVYALDLNTWNWTTVIANGAAGAPAVRCHSTVAYDATTTPPRLIVHGGWDWPANAYSDAFALSLGGTPTWTALTNSGTIRCQHAFGFDTTAYQVLAATGMDAAWNTNQNLQAMDLGLGAPAGTWAYSTTPATVPQGRYWTRGVWNSNARRLIIFGGERFMGGGCSDVWTFR